MRLSRVARSEDWIETEFNNQGNPEGFYTLGNEEAQFQWMGGFSYQWEDADNWSNCEVPQDWVDVRVNQNAEYPILSKHVQLRNLAIQPGATVEMDEFELTVSGIYATRGC